MEWSPSELESWMGFEPIAPCDFPFSRSWRERPRCPGSRRPSHLSARFLPPIFSLQTSRLLYTSSAPQRQDAKACLQVSQMVLPSSSAITLTPANPTFFMAVMAGASECGVWVWCGSGLFPSREPLGVCFSCYWSIITGAFAKVSFIFAKACRWASSYLFCHLFL